MEQEIARDIIQHIGFVRDLGLSSRCRGGSAAWSSRPGFPLSRIVAAAFGLQASDLAGETRGCAKVALARQTAMYLARVSLGLTLSEAAGLFGRDRTTAAHACRVIEDRRDDAGFDAKLTAIEEALR